MVATTSPPVRSRKPTRANPRQALHLDPLAFPLAALGLGLALQGAPDGAGLPPWALDLLWPALGVGVPAAPVWGIGQDVLQGLRQRATAAVAAPSHRPVAPPPPQAGKGGATAGAMGGQTVRDGSPQPFNGAAWLRGEDFAVLAGSPAPSLWGSCLEEGSVTLVTGIPKAGKSQLVAGLVGCIIRGVTSYLGWAVNVARGGEPVAVLCEETPQTYRHKALLMAGVSPLALSRLGRLWWRLRRRFRRPGKRGRPDIHVVSGPLVGERSAETIRGHLLAGADRALEVGARLLILDSIKHWCPEAITEDAPAGVLMAAAKEAAAKIHPKTKKGLAVVMIHHLSEKDGRMLGPTTLFSQADFRLSVTPPPRQTVTGTTERVVTPEGRFDGEAPPPLRYRMVGGVLEGARNDGRERVGGAGDGAPAVPVVPRGREASRRLGGTGVETGTGADTRDVVRGVDGTPLPPSDNGVAERAAAFLAHLASLGGGGDARAVRDAYLAGAGCHAATFFRDVDRLERDGRLVVVRGAPRPGHKAPPHAGYWLPGVPVPTVPAGAAPAVPVHLSRTLDAIRATGADGLTEAGVAVATRDPDASVGRHCRQLHECGLVRRGNSIPYRYTAAETLAPAAPTSDPAYMRYLNSPEWAAKRGEVIERAGGACEREGCVSQERLTVHHLAYAPSYDPAPDEDLATLVALCPAHHLAAHRRRVPSAA